MLILLLSVITLVLSFSVVAAATNTSNTTNKYTMKYYLDGKLISDLTKTCVYGKEYTYPSLPEKKGYSVTGWGVNATLSGTVNAPKSKYKFFVKNNTVINNYAVSTPNSYVIEYYLDKKLVTKQTYYYGTSYQPYSLEAKTGYTASWNTKADMKGTTYKTDTLFQNLSEKNGAVIKLYANNAAKTVKVTFSANGGVSQSTAYEVREDGMIFTRNGDKLNVYTQTLKNNSKFQLRTAYDVDMKKTGYTFLGWIVSGDKSKRLFKESQSIYPAELLKAANASGSSVKLIAQWKADTYSVTYNGNGSTSGYVAPTTRTYNVSQKLPANTFVRKHTIKYVYGDDRSNVSSTKTATFLGWSTSKDGSVMYKDGEDVRNLSYDMFYKTTLYAKWQFPTVTTDKPTRTGYVFEGWYTAKSGGQKVASGGDVIKVSSNETLYAHWKPITYTVRYYLDGQLIPGFDQTCTYDTTYKTHIFPDKNGYFIRGWYTYSNYTGTQYDAATSFKNLQKRNNTVVKLYAKSAKIYTVKIGYSNGFGDVSNANYSVVGIQIKNKSGNTYYQTYKNYESAILDSPSKFGLSRKGYTFAGWYVTSDETETVYEANQSVEITTLCKNIRKDTTIFLAPMWKSNEYTVVYNGNGATSGKTASSKHVYGKGNALTQNGFVREIKVTCKNGGGLRDTVVTGKCKFLGWATSPTGPVKYKNKETVYSLASDKNAKVTLYAKWSDASITLPEPPKRDGYSCLGWYTDEVDGDYISTAGVKCTVSENVTIYAQWKKAPFEETIKHRLYGLVNGEGTTEKKNAICFAVTTKEVWEGKTLKITKDDTLKALPNGVARSVSNGKEQVGTMMLTDGSGTYGKQWKKYNLPQSFPGIKRSGAYEFTYYLIQYKITYNYNGGTAPETPNPTSYNVVYGASFPNEPTRKGYRFLGWALNGYYVTGVNEEPLDRSVFVDSTSVEESAFAQAVRNRQSGNITVKAIWEATRTEPLISPFREYSYARISSYYGYRGSINGKTNSFHGGVDMSAYLNSSSTTLGKNVRAAGDGIVTLSGWNGYGNCIMIDHGNGLVTLYGHLNDRCVSEGDRVSEGDIIGHAGTTYGSGGYSTGPHLHFEVRLNGDRVDPTDYCDFSMNRG